MGDTDNQDHSLQPTNKMNKKQQEEFGMMKQDIKWIKETNIAQNKDIKSIKDSLVKFINTAPEKFACKDTEKKVDILAKKWAWASGAIALLLIVIQIVMGLR